MKITMDDPKSEEVDAVFVDGKRLITCVEVDDEAGYAVVLVPPPDPAKEQKVLDEVGTLVVEDQHDPKDWTRKKIEGKVEIVFKKNEGLDDAGLEK